MNKIHTFASYNSSFRFKEKRVVLALKKDGVIVESNDKKYVIFI